MELEKANQVVIILESIDQLKEAIESARYCVKESRGNVVMEIGLSGTITLPKRSSDMFIKTMEVELAAFEQELKNL